jgi:hypothetical protein
MAHADEAADRLRFRQDDRHPDAFLLRSLQFSHSIA